MYDELVKRLRSQCQGYGKECEDCNADGNCRSQMENEAANAIEELSRENDSLAKSVNEASEILRRRWIPVTERLPESGERVLVSNGKGFVCEAYLSERKRWMRHGCIVDYITPTYWMPLPEPPKEEA